MKRLTRVYIEGIADRILKAYMNLPEIKGAEIYRIDPELLLKRVLGLKIEYAHLSLDGTVLGMTSFGEVEVEVYDEADEEYYLCLDGKTVVVDQELLVDTTKKGRKNFTTLHEGAHQAFKMLFPMEYGAGTKAAELHFYTANSECKKPIFDWEEWQANTLAGALLLPEDLVKRGMFLFGLGDKIKILNKIYNRETYDEIRILREELDIARKRLNSNTDLTAEIKRLTEIFERDDLTFKEFDDRVIRRITECIRVMGDKSIIITLKGGFELREKI